MVDRGATKPGGPTFESAPGGDGIQRIYRSHGEHSGAAKLIANSGGRGIHDAKQRIGHRSRAGDGAGCRHLGDRRTDGEARLTWHKRQTS